MHVECPGCGLNFETDVWENGECSKCERKYSWDEICNEDYTDCWAEICWEMI